MSNLFNPVSSYRIQFHKDFTFAHFERIVTYLHHLGIKTIYASPIFESIPGSSHGYDGVNPNHIDPEIGTEEQLAAISRKLKEKGMYWIQDIVPNHMSYHENNAWLMDVLEKGKDSEYADFFDIDWDHPAYKDKVMVPFPGSRLEEILKEKIPEAKHYALCSWQDTDTRINFRRFFIVNSLLCVNIQNKKVFDEYHRLIRKMIEKDIFQGLRVDHIDGLYDPAAYLENLRTIAGENSFLVVEKILAPDEELENDWPIQGTSGYEFLGIANNIFTNLKAENNFTKLYQHITGDTIPFEQQVYEKKTYILRHHMNGELDNLVRLYLSLQPDERRNPEHLKTSIADYLVRCPVYRYYGDDFKVMKQDEGKDRSKLKEFYSRCMQFTGPLMAKGVEDTLMYTYNRFTGHNEVGDSPALFGYTAEKFHELMKDRQDNWPLAMNATSTHDTKRGEDSRARLNVLTDFYEEWTTLVQQWRTENTRLKTDGAPDANDEYFIYQTLIGSCPCPLAEDDKNYKDRLKEYLHKALREAKVHTQWTASNMPYEEATISFAHRLLDKKNAFLKSFLPFAEKIADFGMINSFAQMTLRFTCPGMPDTYQGTELWDLSLVDPDNRRPVDYAARLHMLQEEKTIKELWDSRHTGQIKLKLLHQLLTIRNEYAEIFLKGTYTPVKAAGMYKDHVLAFMRSYKGKNILAVVPLHISEISKDISDILSVDWKDTKIILPTGAAGWKDLLHTTNTQIFLPMSTALPRLFFSDHPY